MTAIVEEGDWMTDEFLERELKTHPSYGEYVLWRKKYPKVYEKFRELALSCAEKKRHFGMWLIANKLRWDHWWEYNETFKVSNNFTALITRELMIELPVLKKFCRIKKM